MNRIFLLIVIGLVFTSSLIGQVQNEVEQVLASKDFVLFKKYADNLSKKDKSVNSYWECLRDLTTNFKEGVFIFEKSIQDKNNPAVSSVYIFRVTLLTTDKKITYYELSERKNKKVGDDWEPYYELIKKFKDDTAYDSLKVSFSNIYQAELNEKDLFVIDFVYGEHCGFAGVNPKGRKQIEEWVKKKDKTQLLLWLKSTNTEKQLYGLDGLYQLKQTGTKLTADELKIMKFVKNKNGTVYICSGCMHWRDEIKELTRKFKF